MAFEITQSLAAIAAFGCVVYPVINWLNNASNGTITLADVLGFLYVLVGLCIWMKIVAYNLSYTAGEEK